LLKKKKAINDKNFLPQGIGIKVTRKFWPWTNSIVFPFQTHWGKNSFLEIRLENNLKNFLKTFAYLATAL